MPTGSRRGRTWIQAGLIVLWVSALLAVRLEVGDCGGSTDSCNAAAALGRTHLQVTALVVLVMTALALLVLRTSQTMLRWALLVSAAALALAGLWVLTARAARPDWLPVAFLFTGPAALLLLVGALPWNGASGAARRRP